MLGLIEGCEIAGLTCDIQIDEYEPGDPGFFVGHPDNWEPAQPPVFGYTVINPRNCKPWPWLEAKATPKEELKIKQLIIEKIETEIC